MIHDALSCIYVLMIAVDFQGVSHHNTVATKIIRFLPSRVLTFSINLLAVSSHQDNGQAIGVVVGGRSGSQLGMTLVATISPFSLCFLRRLPFS